MYFLLAGEEDMQICTACTTKETHGTIILENVQHCEDKPAEQAGTGYVTDEQSVNHPPTCTPFTIHR